MYPDQNNQSQNQVPQQPDNIFMTQPAPPPSPDEKKRTTLWIVIGLIVGFAVLIAGVFFTFFLLANSAADRYRAETEIHMTALANEIENVDIDSILNRRDTTELLQAVENHEAQKPELQSVIFAESTSVAYRHTMNMQDVINAYYVKVADFVRSLPFLLEFSRSIDIANNDLEVLLEGQPPTTPAAARTVAGSIDNIGNELEEGDTPEALMALRDQLAGAYYQLAEGYRDLATAYEGPEISQAQAERRIDAAERSINSLSATDLTEEVKEYRQNLVNEARTLLSQL